jgi:hypothetical protein
VMGSVVFLYFTSSRGTFATFPKLSTQATLNLTHPLAEKDPLRTELLRFRKYSLHNRLYPDWSYGEERPVIFVLVLSSLQSNRDKV